MTRGVAKADEERRNSSTRFVARAMQEGDFAAFSVTMIGPLARSVVQLLMTLHCTVSGIGRAAPLGRVLSSHFIGDHYFSILVHALCQDKFLVARYCYLTLSPHFFVKRNAYSREVGWSLRVYRVPHNWQTLWQSALEEVANPVPSLCPLFLSLPFCIS